MIGRIFKNVLFDVFSPAIPSTDAPSLAMPSTATVQLAMAGTISEYTASKLDSVKSDLAKMLGIAPSMIRLSVAAAAPPATGVVVSGTMPTAAAADVVAKYAAQQLTTLGSTQVRQEPDVNRTVPSDFAVSFGSRVVRTCIELCACVFLCAVQVLGASLVATPATSIDAATVQLLMVGTLTDYTASKLDSIKFDLAAVARTNPSAISLNVVPTGADVVLSATMPAAAAAEVVAKHTGSAFTTLGSQQVLTNYRTFPFDGAAIRSSVPGALSSVGPLQLRRFRAGLGRESRANDQALCSKVPRQVVDCPGHRR